MKQVRPIVFVVLSLMIASCSRSKDRATEVKSPDKPPLDSTTTKENNRLCSLFTSAEIEQMLGAPVGEGHVAGPMGSACQWNGSNAGDEGANAQIQLINDTRYWEKHTGAKGYEVLHGIGKEAFVATSMFGGWEAGTVTDKAVVYASVSGGPANREVAIKLLRTSLERLGLK